MGGMITSAAYTSFVRESKINEQAEEAMGMQEPA